MVVGGETPPEVAKHRSPSLPVRGHHHKGKRRGGGSGGAGLLHPTRVGVEGMAKDTVPMHFTTEKSLVTSFFRIIQPCCW